MTKEMFETITEWQRTVFTQATDASAAHHLHEEVWELITEMTQTHDAEAIRKEYADCFMLLFGSAALHGMSYEDICAAIQEKFEVNKRRRWGQPNDKGYVKHVD